MAAKKRKAKRSSKKSKRSSSKQASAYKVTTPKAKTVSKHRKLGAAKKAAKAAARKNHKRMRVHGKDGKIIAVCGPDTCSAP